MYISVAWEVTYDGPEAVTMHLRHSSDWASKEQVPRLPIRLATPAAHVLLLVTLDVQNTIISAAATCHLAELSVRSKGRMELDTSPYLLKMVDADSIGVARGVWYAKGLELWR